MEKKPGADDVEEENTLFSRRTNSINCKTQPGFMTTDIIATEKKRVICQHLLIFNDNN